MLLTHSPLSYSVTCSLCLSLSTRAASLTHPTTLTAKTVLLPHSRTRALTHTCVDQLALTYLVFGCNCSSLLCPVCSCVSRAHTPTTPYRCSRPFTAASPHLFVFRLPALPTDTQLKDEHQKGGGSNFLTTHAGTEPLCHPTYLSGKGGRAVSCSSLKQAFGRQPSTCVQPT